MPAISTLAPAALAGPGHGAQVGLGHRSGRPRRRRCRRVRSPHGWGGAASRAGRRERPPDVVSPLTLALITTCPAAPARRCSSRATQPLPRFRPYSADRLSPSTSSWRLRLRWACTAGRTPPQVWRRSGQSRRRPAPSVAGQVRSSNLGAAGRPETHHVRPIIAVQGVTKQVRDATGTLTILHEIDFTCPGAGVGGHRRRLGLGQEHAAGHPGRAGRAQQRHGAAGRRRSVRAGRGRARRGAGRARWASCSRASSCWAPDALENVMLPLELLGRQRRRVGATEMLERVGLAERLGHYPRCCRVASSSAWRWRAPSSCAGGAVGRRTHRQPGLRHRRVGDGADVRAQP
jgi:hypothetical protein